MNSRLFGRLPQGLYDELTNSFNKIVVNYREGRWEPSELNGGKLCEVTYSIVKGYVDGNFPVRSCKPKVNMVKACQLLENAPSTFPRSIRIQLPRMITALYEIRNNRGVGHVGGEVDPNHMDAFVVLSMSKWMMAELIRVFHNVDVQTATDAVELLTNRETPAVWNVNGVKRILKPSLSMRDKTLLILYSEATMSEARLFDCVEHTNSAVYRRDVLVKGHKNKLWEYSKAAKTVTLSPIGIAYVEEKLL